MRWGRRRAAAALVPIAVPAAMRAAFAALARQIDNRRGYLAGFGIYYCTCLGLTFGLAPRDELRRMFSRRSRLPSPRPLAVAALALPPLGGLYTQFLPYWRNTDPVTILASIGIATVNATAEELLWRALPVSLFGTDVIRAWLWPAAGFTAWHLAPLAVRPSQSRGTFLFGTAVIGVGFGWVASRQRSLRLVLPCHIATDAMGLRAARFWLGREAGTGAGPE